jgi:hypothetical protein
MQKNVLAKISDPVCFTSFICRPRLFLHERTNFINSITTHNYLNKALLFVAGYIKLSICDEPTHDFAKTLIDSLILFYIYFE